MNHLPRVNSVCSVFVLLMRMLYTSTAAVRDVYGMWVTRLPQTCAATAAPPLTAAQVPLVYLPLKLQRFAIK
jgi:hypothetical protein